MRSNTIKGEIVVSGGLILLLMFFCLENILATCEQQVINTPSAVSAFNG